jgi:DNA-binding protein HU-beta
MYRSIYTNSDYKISKSRGNWANRWRGKGIKWLSQKRKIAVYVHQLTGIPLAQVSLGLDTLYRLILATVTNRPVPFMGRGHFYYQKVAARKGINPQTGEPIKLKAYGYIAFKPGQYLKQHLTSV